MFIICASIPSSHDAGIFILQPCHVPYFQIRMFWIVLIPYFSQISHIIIIYIATQWVGSTKVKVRIVNGRSTLSCSLAIVGDTNLFKV